MSRIVAALITMLLAPALFAQSGSGVQTASVTLSSAQLLSLHSSPVQLIPPPGAGNIIKPVSITLQYKAGSAPYNASDGNFAIGTPSLPGATHGPGGGFIDQTSDQVAYVGAFGGASGSRGNFENQPIIVQQNGSTDWTAGDGSVVVNISYTIVALQ
ncbi:MAG: hypothetical protein DMG96_16585 [Acidobacteria bacterium]|nr:MAG: hypothetical protein DMG98_07790 [Acidobacteriota bacterium]PYV75580.1 MAG: hypothetical protein DMG96_16585 [Acidobacteriota bacterium]